MFKAFADKGRELHLAWVTSGTPFRSRPRVNTRAPW